MSDPADAEGASPSTDVFTAEKRSAVMRRVKGKDTTPELTVRRLLWRLGARYRLHRADLPGKPDIVLPSRRLAVLVHGCFWHGHDCPRGARVPKQNRAYWEGKVGRNRERDAANRGAMAAKDWRVETVWECELKDEAALEARLRAMLDQTRAVSSSMRADSPSVSCSDALPKARAKPPGPKWQA